MTYIEAIETAMTYLPEDATEAREKLTAMRTKLIERRASSMSEEKKAAASAARKEKTATARAEIVAKVAPVLRETLTHTLEGMTAKDIYSEAAANLPEDFTANKVQAVLLREMRPELNVIEAKGKPNLYTLKSVVD